MGNVEDKRLLLTNTFSHTQLFVRNKMQTFCCSLLQCNKLFTYLVVAFRENCIILQMCSSCMTAVSRYQNSIGKRKHPFRSELLILEKKNAGFYRLGKDKCHIEATSILGRSFVRLKIKLVNTGDVRGV